MRFPVAIAIATAAHAVVIGLAILVGGALPRGVLPGGPAPLPAPSLVAIDVDAIAGSPSSAPPSGTSEAAPSPPSQASPRAAAIDRAAKAPPSRTPAAPPTREDDPASREQGGAAVSAPTSATASEAGTANNEVGTDNSVGGNSVGAKSVGVNPVGSANGGGTVGNGAPRGPADRARLVAEALARIRAQRRYPELARRREIEGRVRVSFRVGNDGRVEQVAVRAGADPLLDDAAVEAVRRAAPLPPIGDAEVELDFRLTDE